MITLISYDTIDPNDHWRKFDRVCKCPACNARFGYKQDDVVSVTTRSRGRGSIAGTRWYVKCPGCKEYIDKRELISAVYDYSTRKYKRL